jgi:hypothetical protein
MFLPDCVFGPSDADRIVRFHHDDPLSSEELISVAGNKISDLLISEGADPLLYRYGEPQLITEQEYDGFVCQGVSE